MTLKTIFKYTLHLALAFSVLLSCKEKTSFADQIELTYPKSDTLTFQKFDEGIGESGTSILYIGTEQKSIPVRYYHTTIEPPPPLPDYKFSKEELELNKKRGKRMANIFYPKNDFTKYSNQPVIYDSLSSKNIEIVVKPNDTIPKYAYNFETETIKKYKAFPVFIKNISDKTLKLSLNKSLGLFVRNQNEKWQLIWNENAALGCFDSSENQWYMELKPNEIMIYSINFLEGKDKADFKILLPFRLKSKSFQMNYDKSLLNKQRNTYEIED